jgi:hypothetical protein
MQTLYNIEKSPDIINGIIGHYKRMILFDRMYCGYFDPIVGKIYKNGYFEDCTCGHALQTVMQNNLELFTSLDSIRGISFNNMIDGNSFGGIGFVHQNDVYNDLETLIPLSRMHNILKRMIDNYGEMFTVWDTMIIIYRSEIDGNTESFDKIIQKLNENDLIRMEYTGRPHERVSEISIELTQSAVQKVSLRASFSYRVE